MQRLILSTDGKGKPKYGDLSTVPDIDVPAVESINYGYTVNGPPTYHKRTYVYVELTDEQARAVVGELEPMLSTPQTVKVVDLDVTERDDLERIVDDAERLGGYLRVEIRVKERGQ